MGFAFLWDGSQWRVFSERWCDLTRATTEDSFWLLNWGQSGRWQRWSQGKQRGYYSGRGIYVTQILFVLWKFEVMHPWNHLRLEAIFGDFYTAKEGMKIKDKHQCGNFWHQRAENSTLRSCEAPEFLKLEACSLVTPAQNGPVFTANLGCLSVLACCVSDKGNLAQINRPAKKNPRYQSDFYNSCLCWVADRVLLLPLGGRPEPLRWENWVQDTGPPETSWPHVISIGKRSPRDHCLNVKTQLHSMTSKLQCWTPHAKQLARQEHNPTH